MTTTYPAGSPLTVQDTHWRTRDIVVTAVIGVAFGVVFWAWNLAYAAAEPLFAFAPPVRDIMYGVWLIPAILAPLVIRKPGAALFAEIVAASVSALLGTVWSVDVLVSGFMQGGAAELIFALTRYRSYAVVTLVAAAAASGVAAWLHDWVIYYPTADITVQAVRLVVMLISAAVIAAGGSILLARSLRQSGALDGFPD